MRECGKEIWFLKRKEGEDAGESVAVVRMRDQNIPGEPTSLYDNQFSPSRWIGTIIYMAFLLFPIFRRLLKRLS